MAALIIPLALHCSSWIFKTILPLSFTLVDVSDSCVGISSLAGVGRHSSGNHKNGESWAENWNVTFTSVRSLRWVHWPRVHTTQPHFTGFWDLPAAVRCNFHRPDIFRCIFGWCSPHGRANTSLVSLSSYSTNNYNDYVEPRRGLPIEILPTPPRQGQGSVPSLDQDFHKLVSGLLDLHDVVV